MLILYSIFRRLCLSAFPGLLSPVNFMYKWTPQRVTYLSRCSIRKTPSRDWHGLGCCVNQTELTKGAVSMYTYLGEARRETLGWMD